MDSPLFQSPVSAHSVRHHRGNSNHFTSHSNILRQRSAVQKRSSPSDRSPISLAQSDRIYQWTSEQSSISGDSSLPSPVVNPQWIHTPDSSPQLPGYSLEPVESFPFTAAVPTPPRSDSGHPAFSLDADDSINSCNPHDFGAFDHPVPHDMSSSSLGYLLPSQYGGAASPYDSDPNDTYSNMNQALLQSKRMAHPTSAAAFPNYAQTASSSPDHYQSRQARPIDNRTLAHQSVDSAYRRANGHYEASNYSLGTGPTIPSLNGVPAQLPSPHGSTSSPSMMLPYTTSIPRSTVYDTSMYPTQTYTTAQASAHLYSTSPPNPQAYMPTSGVNESLAKHAGAGADANRMLNNQRPKPQCWDHGCNGRQFSTFSNLLRHQREKSGTAAKSYCPKCGAEFTRTTARNGHLAHDKCTKQRRLSDAK